MMDVVRVDIDTRILDKFARSCNMSTDQAVRAAALQVEGVAKNLAPVDTGALKNSIHTERKGEMEYTVGDGVEYGIFQELGTHKMPAHPFLIPALKRVVKFINDEVEKAYDKALK